MCRLHVGRPENVQDVRIKVAQKFAHLLAQCRTAGRRLLRGDQLLEAWIAPKRDEGGIDPKPAR